MGMLADSPRDDSLFPDMMINVLNSCLLRVQQKEIPPLFKCYDPPIVVLVNTLDKTSKLLVIDFNPYKREIGVVYRMKSFITLHKANLLIFGISIYRGKR